MHKYILLILIVMMLMAVLMLSACESIKEEDEAVSVTSEITAKSITHLRFSYDMYSGNRFFINAYVEDISDSGAKITLEKSVGPRNYTGHRKEGEIYISGDKARELIEILSSYDLEAWSKLPVKGSSGAPSRNLIVFSGDEKLYDVGWDAKFPKTLPPEEDVMYFELFNFFNNIVAEEAGWEEVRSDNLEDPRENPAYYERTVTWFGNEVKLVPGTGIWHKDGRYAQIDYEGKDWWIEEGFVGEWVLDEEQPTDGFNIPSEARLVVNEDGTVYFVIDGDEWSGKVADIRNYMDYAAFKLEKGFDFRWCKIHCVYKESYGYIHITCYPDPVPNPQFIPIDVYLIKSAVYE